MKMISLIVLTLGLTFVRPDAPAQGTVNFANASTTPGLPPGNRNVVWYQYIGAPFIPGDNVSSNYAGLNLSSLRVQLLFAPPGHPSPTIPTTFTQVDAAQNGISSFKSSTSTTAGSWFTKTATLIGAAPGQTVNLAVVVWDINLSADSLSFPARNSFFWAISPAFQYTIPGGGTPAPSEFLMLNFQGMTVGVPEPSSFSLALLGFFAVLVRRHSACR